MARLDVASLAAKMNVDVEVLKAALLWEYGTYDIGVPFGVRAVSAGIPKIGQQYISGFGEVQTLDVRPAYDFGVRVIVEPNVLEVEVVSFEPVIENGKHAQRALNTGEWFLVNSTFYEWCADFRSRNFYHYVYRKVITKKAVPIE